MDMSSFEHQMAAIDAAIHEMEISPKRAVQSHRIGTGWTLYYIEYDSAISGGMRSAVYCQHGNEKSHIAIFDHVLTAEIIETFVLATAQPHDGKGGNR